MNIYITKDNAELLNSIRGKESMSGLINKLLDTYRAGRGQELFPPTEEASPEPKIIKTKQDAEKAVEPVAYKKTNNWGA